MISITQLIMKKTRWSISNRRLKTTQLHGERFFNFWNQKYNLKEVKI
jgi:hypothetical protein